MAQITKWQCDICKTEFCGKDHLYELPQYSKLVCDKCEPGFERAVVGILGILGMDYTRENTGPREFDRIIFVE